MSVDYYIFTKWKKKCRKRHKFADSAGGVPEGGSLSPILSNILLNEQDEELESCGHPFVCYTADDLILGRSLRVTERMPDIASLRRKKRNY